MDRFIQLQHDTFDPLASAVVPVLLQSLGKFPMDDTEKAAADELRKWNFEANESSSAASIWWMFWENYLHGTFDPWWEAYHVPVDEHPKLDVSSVNASLTANLEQWTLHDPENHYFSNPLTGEKRAAKDVMLQAFRKAVKELRSDWGNQASQWEWGKLHTREFPAMSGIRSFGIGPKGSGGDLFSLDSAGVLRSVHGPTWRMVVDWGTGQSIGIYPGGQSENPNSAWYTDRIDKWWNKGYNPMISGDEAMKNRDHSEWTLSPGGSN